MELSSELSSMRRRSWTHKLLSAMLTLRCGFLSRRSALTPSLLLEEPPAQISAKEPWVSCGVWGKLCRINCKFHGFCSRAVW